MKSVNTLMYSRPRATILCWEGGNFTSVLAFLIFFSFYCLASSVCTSVMFMHKERLSLSLFFLIAVDDLRTFSFSLFRSACLMSRNLQHVVPLQYWPAQTLACCECLLSDPQLLRFCRTPRILLTVFLFYPLATNTFVLLLHLTILLTLRVFFVCL